MGLDSVELIVTVEDKFDIEIPDKECEQIKTVQEFSDVVCSKLDIVPNGEDVFENTFLKVNRAIKKLEIFEGDVYQELKIPEVFALKNRKVYWKALEKELDLELPSLFELKTLFFKNPLSFVEVSIADLVDGIISLNYEKLIDLKRVKSKYEVERVICGIINYNMGIPIHKIKMHHSIVYDLGID